MNGPKHVADSPEVFNFRNLSDIPTERTRLVRAISRPEREPEQTDSPEAEAQRAKRLAQRMERERQIKRYQVAGLSYVRSMLRGDLQAATDVWDQIVLTWLEGRLSNYNRSYSFRLYFKEVLRNAVRSYLRDHLRGGKAAAEQLAADISIEDHRHQSASEEFDAHFRTGLLQRALASLEETDARGHQVLRIQMEAEQAGRKQPRSAELAELFSTTEDNVRTIRKRARDAYARAIVTETAELIGTCDQLRIRETLQELGLMEYCIRALPESPSPLSPRRERGDRE
ncbi:MAG: hypothetical protein ACKO2P_12210 [Planctomycetota bacterium]